MIPILDRYLLKETVKILLAVLGVILFVVTSQRFVNYLGQVAASMLGKEVIFQLLGLQALRYLPLVIPPSLFLALVLTLGRMARDNELVAMQASGVGVFQAYRSLLFLALPTVALVGWLSMEVGPWATGKMDVLKSGQDKEAQLSGVSAGRFNEFDEGDLVFYAESFSDDQKVMRNVFVQNRQHGELGLITAEKGYRWVDPDTENRYVVLTNGYRYVGEPGDANYSVTDFREYGLLLETEPVQTVETSRGAQPSGVLRKSPSLRERAEYQRRLFYPVSVLVLMLLAVPLGHARPGEGMFARFFLAVMGYIVYFNLSGVARTWLEHATTPAWLGMWWVHVVAVLAAAALLLPHTPWIGSVRRLKRRIMPG